MAISIGSKLIGNYEGGNAENGILPRMWLGICRCGGNTDAVIEHEADR